jgi:hypothetical protein
MPGWLTWALVGLAAWCTVSVAFAFLAGHLLGRQRAAEPPRRVVVLAGPMATRVRVRGRGRKLPRAS